MSKKEYKEVSHESFTVVVEEVGAPKVYNANNPFMTAEELARAKRRKDPAIIMSKIAIYAILIIFAIWTLFPFLIVLSTSFKTSSQAFSTEFSWLPKPFSTEGFKAAFVEFVGLEDYGAKPKIIYGFITTLIIIIPPTIIGLFVSALSAFAFAKLNFKGKNAMFSLLLGTMMIPGTIMTTPSFILYNFLGLGQSVFPLMVPGMFGAATCVFFMRQFYSGIPTDLIEAAKLDGMGYYKMFFKIMVPLSVPALFAQGVLGFVGGYNDYFGPLLYLSEWEYPTLQVALTQLTSLFGLRPNVIMASCLVALIPTLILYLVAQKYFIEGIATSGMKL